MFLVSQVTEFIDQIFNYLIWLVEVLGPLGFFIALLIQAVIAPIPSELLLILGGVVFGTVVGGIIGSLGMFFGGIIAFTISKKGGRPIVLKLVGEKTIAFADRWFERWGGWGVLIGRFLPFIPFDGVSYGAGLTKIKFRDFIIASTLGGIPRSFFYAWVGEQIAPYVKGKTISEMVGDIQVALQSGNISQLFETFNLVVLVIGILLVVFLVFYYMVIKKYTTNPPTEITEDNIEVVTESESETKDDMRENKETDVSFKEKKES